MENTNFIPVNIFISYNQVDKKYKKNLLKNLSGLIRIGKINVWEDELILPGQEQNTEVKKNLDRAQINLILISPDFIDWELWHDEIYPQSIKKYEKGEMLIVPIMIRPTDILDLDLKRFHLLPKNMKAISLWNDEDEAWLDVTKSLRYLLENIGHDVNSHEVIPIETDMTFKEWFSILETGWQDFFANHCQILEDNSFDNLLKIQEVRIDAKFCSNLSPLKYCPYIKDIYLMNANEEHSKTLKNFTK